MACLLLTDQSVREHAGQDAGSSYTSFVLSYIRDLHQIWRSGGQAGLGSMWSLKRV